MRYILGIIIGFLVCFVILGDFFYGSLIMQSPIPARITSYIVNRIILEDSKFTKEQMAYIHKKYGLEAE